MPIDTEIEASTVKLTLQPPFTVDQAREALRALAEHPDLDPDSDILVNVRGSQNSSATDIRRYASLLVEGEILRGRVAIATESSLSYGLARMFAVFAAPSGRVIGVFRSVDEARSWLESDDGPFQADLPEAASDGR